MDRVEFALPPSDRHRHATETLWARHLGDGLFEIRNVPFYAMGIAYGDIVRARRATPNLFEEVVERSGHSCYRIAGATPVFLRRWPQLAALGCSYESTGELVAVDVPPTADLQEVYRILESGVETGEWDFEEAYCSLEQ